MTKVTYLDNSGFLVQTADALLVFDYWRDPAHKVVKALEHNPELPVVFFVSSRYKDHFNDAIFNLGQNRRRVYVIADDVKGIADSDMPIAWMGRGDRIEDLPGIRSVESYDTGGEGLSYVVTLTDGHQLMHAGDLNGWHYNQDTTQQEADRVESRFRGALGRIADQHPELDLAFFPVDTRQGEDMARGASELLKTIRVRNFVPMHFEGDYKEACDFKDYGYVGKDTTFYCLHKPGQSAEIA